MNVESLSSPFVSHPYRTTT